MHNNKYTLKSTQLATHNKSFFFEYTMAKRTICSFSETANEIISIKVLQETIKSSRAKVIRIYEVGGTGCRRKLRKFHSVELSTFSNNLHEP